jgi:hypothetical protein
MGQRLFCWVTDDHICLLNVYEWLRKPVKKNQRVNLDERTVKIPVPVGLIG